MFSFMHCIILMFYSIQALSLAFSSKSDFQPVLKIFLELVAVKETPGAIRQQLLTVLQDIHTEVINDSLIRLSS